ncbi:hypothetical protein MAMT_01303 [Methylacidimicrobium tartarophylax]|uniref:Methyltransferase domain-containing protein n=1 Tax=Methylacidimicrobium tartarophylax TaxID=1041768 RepID=A0A5E6MEA9_9BACT|nr:hypothetical protein MAMT_01303 [Methylacidimicrobium tartarophylax]
MRNTREANLRVWNKEYSWSEDGEEWKGQAHLCGVPYAEWKVSVVEHLLAPGIAPGGTVLEIGPGHGRWTAEILPRCGRTILVDLSPNCIEHCRHRFPVSIVWNTTSAMVEAFRPFQRPKSISPGLLTCLSISIEWLLRGIFKSSHGFSDLAVGPFFTMRDAATGLSGFPSFEIAERVADGSTSGFRWEGCGTTTAGGRMFPLGSSERWPARQDSAWSGRFVGGGLVGATGAPLRGLGHLF